MKKLLLKALQHVVLWCAGLLGLLIFFFRGKLAGEDARTAALKAEADRLKALADEQRARHDAELKAKAEAIAAERAKPVDSVAFANDLLKE